jgi:hypothetical protein
MSSTDNAPDPLPLLLLPLALLPLLLSLLLLEASGGLLASAAPAPDAAVVDCAGGSWLVFAACPDGLSEPEPAAASAAVPSSLAGADVGCSDSCLRVPSLLLLLPPAVLPALGSCRLSFCFRRSFFCFSLM